MTVRVRVPFPAPLQFIIVLRDRLAVGRRSLEAKIPGSNPGPAAKKNGRPREGLFGQ